MSAPWRLSRAVAPRADHPHATPAEVHGRGGEPNPRGHVEAVPGKFQLEHSTLADSFDAQLPAGKAKSNSVAFLNGQAGALCNVKTDRGKGCTLVPDLQFATDALSQQHAAGVELGVSAARDQHGADVPDQIAPTAQGPHH